MLFQEFPKSMELSWAWLIPGTVLTTLFFVWIFSEGIRVQFTHNITGKESMSGKEAGVIEDIDGRSGRILINGEYWNAVGDARLSEGNVCEIHEINGLTARVKQIR